jgi:molybdate transport system ATP-binding protein
MAGPLTANFKKRFSPEVVIHGNLEQRPGAHSITALFGPSGCGKTTILRCLAGLEIPDEGSIVFDGSAWFDSDAGIFVPPQRRGIGFMFQDYALFPHLTVAENIAFGLGGSAAARGKRVLELLRRFELEAVQRSRPAQLSGGQQQRAALARAIAPEPRLLLLDEPLSALDAVLREELRAELRRSLIQAGAPVVVVTHDRDEALALGDVLCVMSRGKVLQSGPVLEVFNRPCDPEVARIVRMENLQPGVVSRVEEGLTVVTVGAAQIISSAGSGGMREVYVSIRGEDVILQEHVSAGISVRNKLPARVVALHPGSPLIRVELDAGFPLFAFVTKPACEELALRPGKEIVALIKAPSVHLIERQR